MEIALFMGLTALTYLLYVTVKKYQRRTKYGQKYPEGLILIEHTPRQHTTPPSSRFQDEYSFRNR